MNGAINGDGKPCYTPWQMVPYMLCLGALGFGGSVILVGYMPRTFSMLRHPERYGKCATATF